MDFRIDFFDRPCGTLAIESERFSFRYLDDYVKDPGPPISVIMPVVTDPYPDRVAFPFFENLLPEGRLRQLIAARLRTPENNFERLLENLGGDVAGAITIHPAASDKPRTDKNSARESALEKLTKAELGNVLGLIEVAPFLVGQKEKLRLSLAGAQNKLPVIIIGEDVFLTPDRPTTHIIKPPSQHFSGLVENEYVCMRAAKLAGLNIPEVALIPYIQESQELNCYAINRYDRLTVDGETARLHQEDLCQLMSVASPGKYAKDGGPGFGELFDCVRRFTRPSAVYQNELLRRIFFNLLIGNNDAHGKNFSFLHLNDHVELAPAYDLVCTEAYDELDDSLAMPFGGCTTINQLNESAFRQFESLTDINLRRQVRTIQEFVDRSLRALCEVANEMKQISSPDTARSIEIMERIFARNHQKVTRVLDSQGSKGIAR